MLLHHFLKGLISIVSRLISATISMVPFQSEKKIMEAFSNNRSVMPLDILGCTRATMEILKSSNLDIGNNKYLYLYKYLLLENILTNLKR